MPLLPQGKEQIPASVGLAQCLLTLVATFKVRADAKYHQAYICSRAGGNLDRLAAWPVNRRG